MFAISQHAHFIGIGGIGMSGIAEILLTQKFKVSGSDLRRSAVTDRLASLGATIYEGHNAANIAGATVVVTSSAVSPSNPEVLEARARKIPVIQRAEMLAELMRLKFGIAIAGMHGKTTTTSMVASVLTAGGLDPTIVVGGRVDALGSNARLGATQYMVAEADESDRSFLKLSPILAVVTNLDREHMDTYADMEDVERAFLAFMDKVPFYGAVTACVDNRLLASILNQAQRRILTYGASDGADYRLEMLPSDGGKVSPAFRSPQREFCLDPLNCMCPDGTTSSMQQRQSLHRSTSWISPQAKIAEGLRNFRGVDRRFQKTRRGNAASPWWTITATTPPKSAPRSKQRANAASSGFMSSFNPIATRAPATSWMNSQRHLQTPIRSSCCPSMQPARSQFMA